MVLWELRSVRLIFAILCLSLDDRRLRIIEFVIEVLSVVRRRVIVVSVFALRTEFRTLLLAHCAITCESQVETLSIVNRCYSLFAGRRRHPAARSHRVVREIAVRAQTKNCTPRLRNFTFIRTLRHKGLRHVPHMRSLDA